MQSVLHLLSCGFYNFFSAMMKVSGVFMLFSANTVIHTHRYIQAHTHTGQLSLFQVNQGLLVAAGYLHMACKLFSL